MAERELSLNLSDDAKDLLVEKGWDPSMGARPLRRAIQRYIEDPLADEVLKVDRHAAGRDGRGRPRAGRGRQADPEVKITITQPKRKREAVGVGAKGDAAAELPAGDELPDEPEVLPDVPDAPPAAEGAAPDDKAE